MNARLWLTTAWLSGMIVSLALVELYVWRTNVDGIPFVQPDLRPALLKPIATLYGAHIAGILAAWFIRPFKPLTEAQHARALFVIALVCTLVWNFGAVYLIGQRHLWVDQSGTLVNDLSVATQFGAWFSFLVAPVNLYYFGVKAIAKSA